MLSVRAPGLRLAACASVARDENLDRIWLITTNDNLDALRFYQRRGFRLVAIHPDAVDEDTAQSQTGDSARRLVRYPDARSEARLELHAPNGMT